MDAVLAVSVLAMASAVVWADWVICCCRVSSEAMFQMVRTAKQWGGHKKGYTSETIGQIELKLAQHIPEGACYAVEYWQWCQGHNDVTMGTKIDASS